ncbi:Ribonuclease H-like superfamily [Sesbania bispinosa]|nr:Ribonuclease H-like superfamily [Sesbania bispinosa]
MAGGLEDFMEVKSAQLCQIVPVEAAAGLLANENESAAQRSVVPSHFIACWQKAGMWQLLEQPVSVSEGFQETAFFLLSSLQYNMKHKFAMVLWSLWKQRNEKVWEGVQRATSEVVTRAQEAFTDWNCVKSCGEVGITSVVTSHNFCWFPPQAGRVKCNVDAALFADQNGFGVGLCLRDDKGQYIKSKVLYHHGSPPPREAEALGLLDALSWLGELGMLEVDIELDCKEVVDALHGEAGSLNEFGDILNTITSRPPLRGKKENE